jgi:hypothetical protein
LKICRLSRAVTIGISKSQFFKRLLDRLNHSKAVVRLTLLRILKAICDVHPNRIALVERYGVYETVEKLSKQDQAVLVRELAREILPSLAPALKPVSGRSVKGGENNPKTNLAPKRRIRRTASETSVLDTSVASRSGSTSKLLSAANKTKPTKQKLGEIPWQDDRR